MIGGRQFYTACSLFLLFVCECTEDVASSAVRKSKTCEPLLLSHGRIRYRQKGKLVRFQCNPGYTLAGDRYSSCVYGKWDTALPKCVKPSCSPVKPPVNGNIYSSYHGAVLIFFCKPEYTLLGPNSTYCDGYKWHTNLPTCLKGGTKPATFCDFENDDLCGWSHDLNHDFDWTRQNYKTPSGHLQTGPSYDHTKGPGKDGYYMYIESSSRAVNDTARLISPIYDKIPGNFCVTFYYHMFGATIGQLRVYVKRESEPFDFRVLKPGFQKAGNQGNKWRLGVVKVNGTTEPFQVIIEGIRGHGYISDIAIDDVGVTEKCTEINEVTVADEEVSSSTYEPVESCQDRCENDTLMYSQKSVIACSCVYACITNGTCCPDYTAVCVVGTDETTEEYITSTDSTTVLITTPKTKPTTMKTTAKTTPVKPTTVTTTTSKPTTTLKPTNTTSKITTKTTTLSTSSKPKVEDVNNSVTRKETTSEITKTTKTTTDLPRGDDDDEVTLSPSNDIPVLLVNNSTTNQKIVKDRPINAVSIVIVIFSVLFVILLSLIIVFVIKKYNLKSLYKSKRVGSSNSDSQSDVRFLTSDERLDFNLQQCIDDM